MNIEASLFTAVLYTLPAEVSETGPSFCEALIGLVITTRWGSHLIFFLSDAVLNSSVTSGHDTANK